MRKRRSDLPKTLEGCHALILELYDTIDELRARIAELERELYGTRRERFIADESRGDHDQEDERNEEQDKYDDGPERDVADDDSPPSSPLAPTSVTANDNPEVNPSLVLAAESALDAAARTGRLTVGRTHPPTLAPGTRPGD